MIWGAELVTILTIARERLIENSLDKNVTCSVSSGVSKAYDESLHML